MAHTPVVDFWFDPVCPYSWIGSRWLLEVEAQRPVDLRWHLMSLYLLNEHRTDDSTYVGYLRAVHGVVRVASAAVRRDGEGVLRDLYSAFGERIFDHWRYPVPEERRAALAAAIADLGLPATLVGAFDATEDDEPLRRSHTAAITSVGDDAGTPITHIDGVAFFGPVLNSIPRGDEAVRVFEGALLLAGYPDFFELKRTRTRPPVYT